MKYLQLHANDDAYASDLGMHLRFVVVEDSSSAAGYSLLHFLGELGLTWFEGPGVDAWMATRMTYLMVLMGCFYFSLVLVWRILGQGSRDTPDWRTGALAGALLFVSMIIIPFEGGHYLGHWTPNPWHNSTYTLALVFALAVVWLFLRVLQKGAQFSWISAGGIALAASLSMWSKPSFMMFLMPAIGILLLWLKLRGERSWGEVVGVGATFLPAVGVLMAVQQFVYGGEQVDSQVVVAPGQALGIYSHNISLSILRSSAFPLFVLLASWRRFDRRLALAALCWSIGFFITWLLAESGDRFTHVNFVWTYMGGVLVAFILTAQKWFLGEREVSDGLWWTGTVIFSAHIISGLYYFGIILRGGSYF